MSTNRELRPVAAASLDFLSGSGEMAGFMRAHDWARSPLGHPANWPTALRVAVRLLLNTNHAMYIFWGPEGTCFYNDAYRQSLGPEHHPGSLGRPAFENWEAIWPVIGPQIEQVMIGGGATWNEDQLIPVTRYGKLEQAYWTYSFSPIDDEAALDGVGGVLVVCAETTARVKTERTLAAENSRLETRVEERTRERNRLWQASQDLLVIIDTYGTFVDVSPVALDLLGWTPAEMIGRSMYDFIHPDDQPSTDGALAKAIREVLPSLENRYRHKDGSYRWFAWVAAPVDEFIYATARHITPEKEAQAELAAAQGALRQAQKMEAIGQLTGGIAHDFNNLLAGISGSLELLNKMIAQDRFAEMGRYVDSALGAARRAAALTQRLLAFARRQTLDPKATDPNLLVLHMEELIRRTVGPAVDVDVRCGSEPWNILVDAHQLENSLLNLCINARDAMPDGGRLTIETANRHVDDRSARERDLPPGEYVTMCVTDTGTGMTPEVLSRAFDPFYTTKPTGMGTGLGLSMVYGFARQSGGQVRMHSQPGSGTTARIYLPRHRGEVLQPSAAAGAQVSTPAGRGRTVLVIDDEPTVRLLVCDVLQELGFELLQAAEGASGLELLHSHPGIDLLITDVGLPGGLNGRQVADEARNLRPDLKILFITGYAENALFGDGQLDHGMHVLTKPFPIEVLESKVHDLVA